MINVAFNNLRMRASEIARAANMNENTVRNIVNGKEATASNYNAVVAVLAARYMEIRPINPEELDRLCWKALFGLAPYPQTSARATRKKESYETKPERFDANDTATDSSANSLQRIGRRNRLSAGMVPAVGTRHGDSVPNSISSMDESAYEARQASEDRQANAGIGTQLESNFNETESLCTSQTTEDIQSGLISITKQSPLVSEVSSVGTTTQSTVQKLPFSPKASNPHAGQGAILQAPTVDGGHHDSQPGAHFPGCDFSVPESAAKHFPNIRTNAARAAFIDACCQHAWTLPKREVNPDPAKAATSRRAWIIRELRRLAGGITLRTKAPDPDVTIRKDRIFNAVSMFVAWAEKNSSQSKGAYDLHSFGHRNETVAKMLTNDHFVNAATDPKTGMVPSVEQVCSVLRERNWFVDSRNAVESFVAETIGTRPRYIGDEIMADWSGLPCKVDGAIIEFIDQRTGEKKKKHKKFGFHIAVDVASNFTWVDLTYGDNEYATWFGFLKRLLFRDLGYFPGWLIMDQVSGVLTSLRKLNPDNVFPDIDPVLIAWAGGGTRFNVHTPEHAQAKGNVEVAGKLFKHRSFHGASIRKTLEKHMTGVLAKPRKNVSHAELLSIFQEAKRDVNERLLCRDGQDMGPRKEIWKGTAEDIRIRNEDAIVTNGEAIYEDIAARSKVAVCNGKLLDLRIEGKRYYAELSGFEQAGISQPKGDTALIIPNGLRAADDPDGFRVCLIQKNEKGGLPRFASLTAKVCAKDRLGYDIIRPHRGEGYHAKTETRADELKRAQDKAGNDWAKVVNGTRTPVKQATTNERYYE